MTSARKSVSRRKSASKSSQSNQKTANRTPTRKSVAKKSAAKRSAAKNSAAKKSVSNARTENTPKKRAAKSGSRAPRRRAGPQDPSIEIDADVLEFIDAIDTYRQQHARPFPSWSEVLHVLRELGYRKTRR